MAKLWINPFPSYQGYRPGAGAGYIRYDQETQWYTPKNVDNGDAIWKLLDEAQNAANDSAFFGTRLIWNHVGIDRSLAGMRVLTFIRESDGKIGYVADIRDPETLDVMMRVEQKEHDELGYLYDFRQWGFGVLNENSFFDHACPFTTAQILNYYDRMWAVWGRKLMICVGGSSTYIKPLLEMLGISDNKPQAVFQDNFIREGWDAGLGDNPPETAYTIFVGGNWYTTVEAWLGYKPMIWWCEVSGGPNGRPHLAGDAYKMFIAERGMFFANMGAIPNYPGTQLFAATVGEYSGILLRDFLAWSQEVEPPVEPPIEPPTGIDEMLDEILATVKDIQDIQELEMEILLSLSQSNKYFADWLSSFSVSSSVQSLNEDNPFGPN